VQPVYHVGESVCKTAAWILCYCVEYLCQPVHV